MSGCYDNLKIIIKGCDTSGSESDWIARQIDQMTGGLRHFSIDSSVSDGSESEGISGLGDFAVLCRTSLMYESIKQAFDNYSIPYQIVGEKPFYKNEPFNTVINFLRELVLKNKIINSKKIFADNKEILYKDVSGNEEILMLLDKNFEIIDSMICEKKSISEIFEFISKIIPGQNNEITNDFNKIIEFGKSYTNNYSEFLIKILLNSSIDFFTIDSEKVSVMTIHSAKGLEFKTVFIPGCEEGIIPFELYEKKKPEDIEEEKRLFYVGITRTSKYLFLTHSKKRVIKGKIFYPARTRFIDSIEKTLYDRSIRIKLKPRINENLELPL